MAAISLTYLTTDTIIQIDLRLRRRMKFQFSSHAGRTHTQVLQCSTETTLLVSLEMIHGNHDIGIRNRSSDLRRWTLRTTTWNFFIVCTLKTVCNDDISMGSNSIESILHCCAQMIYSIGSTTGI